MCARRKPVGVTGEARTASTPRLNSYTDVEIIVPPLVRAAVDASDSIFKNRYENIVSLLNAMRREQQRGSASSCYLT